MTDEQREQVVELLRCAADEDPREFWPNMINGLTGAEIALGLDGRSGESIRVSAHLAMLSCDMGGVTDDEYRAELLEAAQRVEDGEWP